MKYAHFMQPGKSLYTTVRELVENGLDSCEAIGEPPIVAIAMYGSSVNLALTCSAMKKFPVFSVALFV